MNTQAGKGKNDDENNGESGPKWVTPGGDDDENDDESGPKWVTPGDDCCLFFIRIGTGKGSNSTPQSFKLSQQSTSSHLTDVVTLVNCSRRAALLCRSELQ